MENLRSPLNGDELKKIDTFLSENKDRLSRLSFSAYRDLMHFKVHVEDFDYFLTDLSVNEKIRAWTHLYSVAKKAKEANKNVPKNNLVNVEPNYNFTISAERNSQIAKIISGFIIITLLIFLLIWIFASGDDDKKPSEADLEFNRMIVSQESVKKLLKDPDSAKFKNMRGLCGEVNSKNSFGGYTGFRKFIGSPDLTIIEGENPEIDQVTFNDIWIRFCK
ncbi:hypothetical protein ACG9Y4_11505 [Acinetobacter guillouiae]|uniref:hypothetical protein n=1 Tax=Acinetobacter guillouiae TaxID=106649 RepID=UPI003AF53320